MEPQRRRLQLANLVPGGKLPDQMGHEQTYQPVFGLWFEIEVSTEVVD
jgi:hypothetical protein